MLHRRFFVTAIKYCYYYCYITRTNVHVMYWQAFHRVTVDTVLQQMSSYSLSLLFCLHSVEVLNMDRYNCDLCNKPAAVVYMIAEEPNQLQDAKLYDTVVLGSYYVMEQLDTIKLCCKHTDHYSSIGVICWLI